MKKSLVMWLSVPALSRDIIVGLKRGER